MKRILTILTLLLVTFVLSTPSPTHAEVLPGTLKPNDLFMPYPGGVVAFNLFDQTAPGYPVRGWFIERGTHGLADMRGIAIGPDGNFYLAATPGDVGGFSDSILRFNGTTGKFIDEFVPPGSGGLYYPQGLIFLPDGNLYVASGTRDILRYNGTTGAPTTNPIAIPAETFQNGGVPTGLLQGADGCLYIAVWDYWSGGAYSCIMRFNPVTGITSQFASGGGLVYPSQMAFGPDGNLYVADQWGGAAAVKVFNGTTGVSIDRFPNGLGDLTGANGLAFGPDGLLYIDGGTISPEGAGTGVIDRYNPTTGFFLDRLVTPNNFPPSGAGGGALLFNKGITQVGNGVVVTPIPTASLNFETIIAQGQTVVTPLNSAIVNLPTNFDVATSTGGFASYFDITTTASFTGAVSLGISYDPTQFRSDINPTGPDPRLLHYNNGTWVDITSTFDTVAHKVYGVTSSFSPFAIVRHAAYSWSGVLEPINADGSSVFKKGSTIPVKFKLTGADAGITNLKAKLYLSQTDSVDPTEANEAVSTSAADTGNTFRYSGGQYIFNLSTKSLTQGTWYLRIDLGDGVNRVVQIKLKK